MALNGKFVKVERVLEKVRRDLPGNYTLSLFDAIEMIGEAISSIGSYSAYTSKVTDGNKAIGHPDPVEIINYRAKLPCDLYKLNSIRFITNYDSENRIIVSSIPTLTTSDVFHMNSNRYVTSEMDLTTKINDGYVYMSGVAVGLLEISYEAFVTDDRGYPMVPDEDMYVKALAAYIQERIGFRLYMEDKITDRKYSLLEQNWLYYVNSAYSQSLLQNIDDAESFKNSYVRMINDSSAHSSGYRLENRQQEYNIHNY